MPKNLLSVELLFEFLSRQSSFRFFDDKSIVQKFQTNETLKKNFFLKQEKFFSWVKMKWRRFLSDENFQWLVETQKMVDARNVESRSRRFRPEIFFEVFGPTPNSREQITSLSYIYNQEINLMFNELNCGHFRATKAFQDPLETLRTLQTLKLD